MNLTFYSLYFDETLKETIKYGVWYEDGGGGRQKTAQDNLACY